jgi:small subunit ribosomal protein S2
MEEQLISQQQVIGSEKTDDNELSEQNISVPLVSEFGLVLEDMYKAGVHLGHRISRLHPKMKQYVFGIKSTVHIIDLEKTFQKFEEALLLLRELRQKNPMILFVGTSPQHKDLVSDMIKDTGMPFVVNRWLGGTLTNFPTLQKRIEYIKELEDKRRSPLFDQYTKKEKHDIEKEIEELNIKFGGFRNMNRIPDLVFVVDLKKDALAIREAKRKGVPTMGIADTNVDPTFVDYPIPANDDATSSVQYILGKIVEVLNAN